MLVTLPDGQRTPGLVRGVEADGFVQVSVGSWRGDPSEEEVDVPADAPTRIEVGASGIMPWPIPSSISHSL